MSARVLVIVGLVLVAVAAVLWGLSGDDDGEAQRRAEEARLAERAARQEKRRARKDERRRTPLEAVPPVTRTERPPADAAPTSPDAPAEKVELPEGWREEVARLREFPAAEHFPYAAFRAFLVADQLRPIGALTPETKGGPAEQLAVRDAVDRAIPKSVKYRGLYLAGGTTDDAALELDGQRALFVRGDLRGTLKVEGQTYVHVTGDLVGNIEGSGQLMLEVRGSVLGNVTGIAQASLRVGGDITGATTITSVNGADVGGRITGTREWTTTSGTFFWRHAASLEEIQELGKPGGPLLHLRNSDLAYGEHTDVKGWKRVVVGDTIWNDLPDVRE